MAKNLSSFLQWQPNVSLIQKMGWPMAFRYVSFLGSLYYFFRAKEKRKIIEAIQEAFAETKHSQEIRTITRDVFRGILHHYCEKLFNAYFQWYDSDAMAYLRGLPNNVSIYTNEPAAVYLYVRRGAKVLPDRYDTATAQARAGFEESVQQMQGEINAGNAVLVLFDNGENVANDTAILTNGLHPAFKAQGDSIYAADP